jgi:hypothetical protein
MHVRVQAVNAIENESASYHPLNLQMMAQWTKGAARNFKVEGSYEVLIGGSEDHAVETIRHSNIVVLCIPH